MVFKRRHPDTKSYDLSATCSLSALAVITGNACVRDMRLKVVFSENTVYRETSDFPKVPQI